MSKIPIVIIKKLRTVLKSELPTNAPIGRPIITTDTCEMFIGTGDTTPLIRIEELMTLNDASELTQDKGTSQKLYLTKNSNEYFYFYNNSFIKINGVGILNVVDKYSDLPTNNEIEGLFAIKTDETNNNLSGIYFYNKSSNTYIRLSFVNFKSTFVGLNIDNVDLLATGSNNILSINSGNLMNLEADTINNQITISQKASIDVEFEMKTYTMNSGVKSALPVAMDGVNCVSINDKIYCFGGRPQSGIPPNTIYTYDETNGWKNIGLTTPFTKAFMSTNTYNGKIYLAGGFYTNNTSYYSYNNLYEFDPILNTFTEKAPMNQKRHACCSAVIGDKLWVVGGVVYTSTSSTTYADVKSVEYYDFATDTWTLLGTSYNMPLSTYGSGCFVIGNEIHCVGGYNKSSESYRNNHQVFNTETLTWTNKAVYPYSYHALRGISCNGLGYVMGGYPIGGSPMSKYTYVYVPNMDVWIRRDDISIARSNFSVVYYNNSIYTIGGGYYYTDSNGNLAYARTSVVESYTPIYDTESKDYQVILRSPQKIGATTNISNLLNNDTSELNRNLTLEANRYWEYGDWQTKGQVEVLVKRYNYS